MAEMPTLSQMFIGLQQAWNWIDVNSRNPVMGLTRRCRSPLGNPNCCPIKAAQNAAHLGHKTSLSTPTWTPTNGTPSSGLYGKISRVV